jgi:hypothetical protein
MSASTMSGTGNETGNETGNATAAAADFQAIVRLEGV